MSVFVLSRIVAARIHARLSASLTHHTFFATVTRREDGLIESKVHHHRDTHHVGAILHHDSLHANNIRVHVPNPANPIHDDDVQCLRVSNHNYQLHLRFRTVFVWDIHSPAVHIHDDNEWAIGNDAILYTDIVSVVLWAKLFIVIPASVQSCGTSSPTGLLVDQPGGRDQGY